MKGDPRRPPEWFGRGLLYTAIAVVVFVFVWNAWGDIRGLVLDVIIALFISSSSSLLSVYRLLKCFILM